ncbi:hypothetical protein CASFOL_039217 [Castilleja foliolosa]|uniref:Uncharacterized protein n=1 Tax=Castilleja foliolosa TaxID=1961234 RepID=A0ABD3BHD8_9LAMI
MQRLKTRYLLPNIFPLIISALTTASISLRNKVQQNISCSLCP